MDPPVRPVPAELTLPTVEGPSCESPSGNVSSPIRAPMRYRAFSALTRKVAICPRVTRLFGLNVVEDVPTVMPTR